MLTLLSSVGHMYLHINAPAREMVVVELLLRYPEKTIAEMLDEVYEETRSCSMLHQLLFETKVVTKQHNRRKLF